MSDYGPIVPSRRLAPGEPGYNPDPVYNPETTIDPQHYPQFYNDTHNNPVTPLPDGTGGNGGNATAPLNAPSNSSNGAAPGSNASGSSQTLAGEVSTRIFFLLLGVILLIMGLIWAMHKTNIT